MLSVRYCAQNIHKRELFYIKRSNLLAVKMLLFWNLTLHIYVKLCPRLWCMVATEKSQLNTVLIKFGTYYSGKQILSSCVEILNRKLICLNFVFTEDRLYQET